MMGIPPVWLAVGLGVLAVLVAIPGIIAFATGASHSDKLDKRLDTRAGASAVMRSGAGQNEGMFAGLSRLVARFGKSSTPDDESEVSAARFKLIQAGYSSRSAVSWYYAARFFCVVAPQILLLFLLPQFRDMPDIAPVVASIALALGGLAVPGFYLSQKISARRLACSNGFPDMMDLLVACVEAGLSLDAAVSRVGEELRDRHPVLSGHLRQISLELRAGRSSRGAWRNFADRVGLEEAGSLATMLRQAEEMGTSLGATMRIFATDMRQRRILKAEEKAMALPAKMTVPLIVFVFPVLLGMLITPAIYRFQAVFAAT